MAPIDLPDGDTNMAESGKALLHSQKQVGRQMGTSRLQKLTKAQDLNKDDIVTQLGALHLVGVAKEIKQPGNVQRNPDTQPSTIAHPSATQTYDIFNKPHASIDPPKIKPRAKGRQQYYERNKDLQTRNTQPPPLFKITKNHTKKSKTNRERYEHRESMRTLATRLEKENRAAGEPVDAAKVAEILMVFLDHKMEKSDEGSDGGAHDEMMGDGES